MNPEPQTTFFAPAERVDRDSLLSHHEAIMAVPIVKRVLDSMPTMVLIINRQRQVLFANKAFLDLLSIKDMIDALGLRPGEALDCIHASEMPAGCGTSESCSTCGAVISILAAIEGNPTSHECRVIRADPADPDSLDLKIFACPTVIGDRDYVLLTVEDIGNEKRRKALERIFFHDVLNSAGALSGLLETLKDADAKMVMEYWQTMQTLSNAVVDEIKAQRELNAAESGDLVVSSFPIDATAIVNQAKSHYATLAMNAGVTISTDCSPHTIVNTDPVLLLRIIGNMLKNAIEAQPIDDKVTLGYTFDTSEVVFFVRNHSYMPRDSQLQVFQRSFSTKSPSRGLGTYSVRILCEKYLGGRVWFTSTEEDGTSFYASLPLKSTKSDK